MGIFQRLGTLFKSNINDAISSAEDPKKMLDQMMMDMKKQLIESKKQVAKAIADEKSLKRQYLQEADKTDEWERRAMLAVKKGDDGLAAQALARKTEHENVASQYKTQHDGQLSAVTKLKDSLFDLNNRIEEAGRKKHLLVARAKRVEAQKSIKDTMSSLSDSSAFDVMERMTKKVDAMEAETEAFEELEGDVGPESLENKFKELESTPSDQAVLELKRKMGLLPPAEETSTEQKKLTE